MDYEKAFKEAYERASLRFGTNIANELFLEYKESKEERTRRKLIEFFSDWSKTKSHCWGIRVTDIMDWLEKQGTSYTKRDVDDAYIEGMAFAKDELEKQKSAEWSEEDERMYSIVFEEYKNRQYYSHPTLEDYDISGQILGWLKSIKQRYTWKPSDEQMEALWCATEKYLESDNANVVELRGKVLESLYNDLKKLTE